MSVHSSCMSGRHRTCPDRVCLSLRLALVAGLLSACIAGIGAAKHPARRAILGGVVVSLADCQVTPCVARDGFYALDRTVVNNAGTLGYATITFFVSASSTKLRMSCIDQSGTPVPTTQSADVPYDNSNTTLSVVNGATKGTATLLMPLYVGVATYTCIGTETVNGATADTDELGLRTIPDAPTLNTPNDGYPGYVRLSGSNQGMMTVTVDSAASRAVVTCTQLDANGNAVSPTVTVSNANQDFDGNIASKSGTTATIKITMLLNTKYRCTATQTVSSSTSGSGNVVTINTTPPPPVAVIATSGFVVLTSSNAYVTVTVSETSTRLVTTCTATGSQVIVPSPAADYDSTNVVKSGTTATVKMPLLSNKNYSCTAIQKVGGVDASASATVYIHTIIPSPTVSTTGFVQLDGNGKATVQLSVHVNSTRASVTCTDTQQTQKVGPDPAANYGTTDSSVSIVNGVATASIKIALDGTNGGKAYTCTATQTVGGLASTASSSVSISTIVTPPTITTTGFVVLSSGKATLSVTVEPSSSRAVVTCVPSSGTTQSNADQDYDSTTAVHAAQSTTATIKITMEASKNYSCTATQTIGTATSAAGAAVYIYTNVPAPTITTTGFVPIASSKASVSLTVHLNATRAIVTCTDGISTVVGPDPAADFADNSDSVKSGTTAMIQLALLAGTTYSCTATQTVAGITSAASAPVSVSPTTLERRRATSMCVKHPWPTNVCSSVAGIGAP